MESIMASRQRRIRPLESVVSVCLLFVLVLIAIGIFIKQSDYDPGRFGVDPVAAGVIALKPSQTDYPVSPQVPDALAPPGFKPLSQTEVYGAENLYEKINGRAPFYVESGFVKLLTQRFVSEADESLWFELYLFDMADIRNAFSVFSRQRRADTTVPPGFDPWYAYSTGNALYYISGRYYVELIGSAESDTLLAAITAAGENLHKQLSVDKAEHIAELSLLPPEHIIPGSGKLYLAGAFGFDRLTDIIACRYRLGDETVTAFVGRRTNAQAAGETAKSYADFLVENGAEIKPVVDEKLKAAGARLLDFYGTAEIVFSAGPFLAGIHEAENRQVAEQLAVTLLDRLSEAAEAPDNE